MKTQKPNILATVIKALMPIVAIAVLIMYEYTKFGANFEINTENTTKAVLSIVCLLFFFLPIKDIFKDMFKVSARTVEKVKLYADNVETVVNGQIESFKAFCTDEYRERRKSAVMAAIRNTALSFDEFEKRYKYDKNTVKSARKSKEITAKEAKAFLCAIREERRVKPETVDTILPSGKHAGDRRRVKSSARKRDTFNTAWKTLACCVSGTVLISITIGFDGVGNAVEIITNVLLMLGLALWQMFSAFIAAKNINDEYCNELSEKTFFIDEFLERTNRRTNAQID